MIRSAIRADEWMIRGSRLCTIAAASVRGMWISAGVQDEHAHVPQPDVASEAT